MTELTATSDDYYLRLARLYALIERQRDFCSSAFYAHVLVFMVLTIILSHPLDYAGWAMTAASLLWLIPQQSADRSLVNLQKGFSDASQLSRLERDS